MDSGHADCGHVPLLKDEACPETSLGVRTACCGTAHVCAGSPSGWQMEVAVGTLPASQGHPVPSLPDCAWKQLRGALAQPQ